MFNDSFFIGFEDMLQRANQKAVSFPPYNLLKEGENTYIIELAVAGFSKSEISIILDKNILEIRGKKIEQNSGPQVLYKGISAKSFTRTFTVADTIEVVSATYDNGILKITLNNVVNQKNTKMISIS